MKLFLGILQIAFFLVAIPMIFVIMKALWHETSESNKKVPTPTSEDLRKEKFCEYACGSYVVQKVLDNNRCVCNTSLVIREAK